LEIALNTYPETWLQDKFNALCTADGQRPGPAGLRISPPIAVWEAQFLARGLEENLFEADERGHIESELLQTAPETEATPRPYRIFSHEPVRLIRENVCQLAAASRLVFERGWLRRHVSLEPGRTEHSTTTDHFDLLVRSATGNIFIWVEARRTSAELHKLVADLRACSRRGPHAHADCGFPQNHPRHEFCVANQPMCLWAVAPDGEIFFEVKCDGPAIAFEPLSSLPGRSRFELG
jgi:hypothetical protein